MKEVLEITQEGIWDWNIKTGEVKHNEQWYTIFGFEENDLSTLIEQLKQTPHLYIQSVFSHLAGSDDHVHDNFTRKQFEKFVSPRSRKFPAKGVL